MKEYWELLLVVAVVGIPVGFSVNNSIFKVGRALEEKLNELQEKVDSLQEKLGEIEEKIDGIENRLDGKRYINPIEFR
jgi:prefoldin subunit 5